MKRIREKCTITVMVLLLWGSAAWAEPLVWVTDDTPGGYYIVGGGASFEKEKPGVEIELYRMVAKKLNLDIRFKRLPWKHCLYLIEQNRVDGIFPASFKSERMKIGAYPMKGKTVDTSRKTRDNAYYLYKLKKNPIGWNGTAFAHVSGHVGVPGGWSIAGDLKSKYDFIIEDHINGNTPNLLVHGRLQGYVCLSTVFDAYLNRQPEAFGSIVKVQPPVSLKPNYLMLSREFVSIHPQLAEKIWDTIREIKKSWEYTRMVDGYLE